jgi:glutaredoxin 2
MGLFDMFSSTSAPTDVPSPDQERSLALYKYDSCPFCMRVMHHVRGLGLEVEMRDIHRDPEARRQLMTYTGHTQVPMLLIDDVPMLESADINRWLSAYAKRGEA